VTGRAGPVGAAAVVGLLSGGCAAVPPRAAGPTGAPVTAAAIVTPPAPDGSHLALAEARRFVFRVRNEPCLATGTAFAFDGTVVSNRHVAAGATQLDLATWDGDDFEARVGGHGDTADLVRLSASAPGGAAGPEAAAGDPPPGTTVYVTGYPEGDQLTVTSGTVATVTSMAGIGVSGPILELAAKVEPGNSGSPLLDATGQLVGVVFAIDTANGDGLAMPLSTLRRFLAADGDPSPLPCSQ
jgi:S1-C subfamily serine protease